MRRECSWLESCAPEGADSWRYQLTTLLAANSVSILKGVSLRLPWGNNRSAYKPPPAEDERSGHVNSILWLWSQADLGLNSSFATSPCDLGRSDSGQLAFPSCT